MKKFFLGLLLLGSTLCANPHHSPELSAPLKALYRMQETKQLIEAVEAQGTLTLKAAYLGPEATQAAWYPNERAIYINYSNQGTEGSVIRFLVFELNNALIEKQFGYMDYLATQGKISKEEYVRTVEQLEFQNAQRALALLKKGVEKGVFPADAADWPVPSSFAEHYKMQLEAGHSQAIANLYDQLRNVQQKNQ